jgi:hypothetical protein
MFNRIIIITALTVPVMAMADRPAMSERYSEPAQPEPMAVEQPEQTEVFVEEVVVEQVTGDVLELQPGEITISPLDFPRRGMSMDKVQNELGQPAVISPSVGEPPITSWTYQDRVVFFEYSRVIHAVLKR